MKRALIALLILIAFGLRAQECGIIYVTPNGATSGAAGTKSNPAELNYAFTLIGVGNSTLWLAAGTYTFSTTFNMVSGLTIEGGFDPATWEKTNFMTTVLTRTSANILTNPNNMLIGISAIGQTNFGIHDLTLTTDNADPNDPSTTVYGAYVSNCSNFYFTRTTVIAGNGTDGLPGVPGTDGQSGADGVQGESGADDSFCCMLGGAGGNSWSAGAVAGGTGGKGGDQGSLGSCSQSDAPDGLSGLPGATTSAATAGTGGLGGQGFCDCAGILGTIAPVNIGKPGVDGADGPDGLVGLDGTPTHNSGYFVPGDGLVGDNGSAGAGGGGGGGGGSQGCVLGTPLGDNGSGPGGGGGGEGGEGGYGATGGGGGGGSFGLYLNVNGANSNLKDCDITSGLQGLGAPGGAPGGFGGMGGNGGLGGNTAPTVNGDVPSGGPGGKGGRGGLGGNGGNGVPGLSNPIYEDPAGAPIAESNMKSTVEPGVTVSNKGCSLHEIYYNSTANGIINWYYDGGSMPLSGNGNSSLTFYSTLGRHSTTLVADGLPYILTDFTGIITDGTPFLPTILASDNIICPGDNVTFSATFTSAFTVTGYRWKVYDGSTPTTYSAASPSHTFNSVGEFMVTLQTESVCCGWTIPDTFYVSVVPYLQPEIYVTPSATEICQGESISFGSVAINGGSAPTYSWQVNGAATGTTTSTYTAANWTDGDQVVCQMVSNYECPINNNPQASSTPITITVHQNPTASCSLTGVYLGGTTTFNMTANGTAPYQISWSFGDGGIDTGAVASHYYGGTGQYNYSATVTDANGCEGTCSGTIDIQLPPYLDAGYLYNVVPACGSAAVTFTDTSTGAPINWQWDFGDGTTSTLSSPSHTYTQPGHYTVTLIADNGVFSDTAVYPNIVEVWPEPVADFEAVRTQGCEPFSTQFIQKSSDADSWFWNFGDGSYSQDPSPSHAYSQPGAYDVELIVVSAEGCQDTLTLPAFIQVLETPEADFTADKTLICEEDSIQFTDMSSANFPNNQLSWEWHFGDGAVSTQQNPLHTFEYAGTYDVVLTVINNLGCSDTEIKFAHVDVLVKPMAAFSVDTSILQLPYDEVYITNWSQNYYTWEWDFGDGTKDSTELNPHKLYADSGTYVVWLYLTHQLGCQDSTSKVIHVIEQQSYYIPSAFTPNGDGKNEMFMVQGKSIIEFHMDVFDRWGELVFSSDDVTIGWDGTFDGAEAPEGTYVYKVNLKLGTENILTGPDAPQQLVRKVGKVMLLRSL